MKIWVLNNMLAARTCTISKRRKREVRKTAGNGTYDSSYKGTRMLQYENNIAKRRTANVAT